MEVGHGSVIVLIPEIRVLGNPYTYTYTQD
jgi:hypothetical protein